MDIQAVKKAYKRYAPWYDLIFNKVLGQGRKLAVNIINDNIGEQGSVLEVGLGTGLSLPSYRRNLTITGIDVSQEMLEKAKQRIHEQALVNCTAIEMDATKLRFPADKFNGVVAMYVVSVVPDVKTFLNEIVRVCVTNGDIIIVNHFMSENAFLRRSEKLLSPLHKILGFETTLSINTILTHPQLQLLKIYKVNFLGYWRLLHFKKI